MDTIDYCLEEKPQ